MKKNNDCDIGTLASPIMNDSEISNANIVKVSVDQKLENDSFFRAKDFFRKRNEFIREKTYHHLGIYIFTSDALTRYVNLKRSKLEIERNLEQMRAMENNMIVKVGLTHSMPLSVDTEEDLKKVEKEIN